MAKPYSNTAYKDENILHLSFDTETEGLGGKLLCITACDLFDTYLFKGENMVHEFFEMAMNYPTPAVWYAHNAQYDWRYFLDYIKDNQLSVEIAMRTETDIYQLIVYIDGARIVMRDSMAVFPGKLADFAKAFVPESPKLDLDFELETFDPHNERHCEYAKRDAEILRKGMPRMDAMLQKHFGVTLGHTTAGTALKAWQSTLPDRSIFSSSEWNEREQFIRDGYYGGLSFLTRTDVIMNPLTVDINSSYPDKMCRYGVPHGRCISTRYIDHSRIGIYRVRVRTPDNLVLPILPCRDARGAMRWHRGTFETTVTGDEIAFSLEHGYDLLDIFEGLEWEERIFPFNDFIERCKTIRRDYKGQAEEIWAKLLQNALYGKFASRRERLTVFMAFNDEDTLGAHPLDDAGFFWMKKEFNEDMRCKPEWSVYITARARLQLMESAYRVGIENVINGDTDSLTVLPHVIDQFDIGDEYGQWKIDKRWKSMRAIAPKVYTGELESGEWKGAIKGIPRRKMTRPLWQALMQGEQIGVEYDSLPALRVAMKHGVKPAIKATRQSTALDHSLNWECHNHRVQPRMHEETKL